MTKHFSSLVVALLLFISAAHTQVSMTIGSASNISNGQQVCLDVTASAFTNIIGMQFSIAYNPAALQFVSVSNFGLPGLTVGTFGIPIAGGAGITNPGTITVSWLDADLSGETLANGTRVFTLCFTALTGTGSTTVSFANSPTPIELINTADMIVPLNGMGGTVTFSGGGGSTPNPLGLTIASASNVMSGQQVCLNVTANEFTNLNALSFSINYTASQLTFVSVGNFNVPGLSATNFNTGTAGTITMSWTNTSGQTLSNGSVLFNICFTATATTGSTQVSFANTPTMLSATNAAGQSVTVNPTSGTVSFTSGSNPTGFTLTVASATNVAMGQQVCLNVTAANFTSIVGMQFSINYNPAQLQFVSVGSFGLPGMSISSFGIPIAGGAGLTSAGNITLSWTDPDLGGETLANGATVFQLCFTALAGSGSTNVSFSGMPTAIEVINASDQTVPFNSVPGTVSFTGGGGNPTGFTLTVASATNVAMGDQVCLNVTAANFTSIVGMQFSINYNPAMLQFVSVGSFGLPGLAISSFGMPIAGGAGLTSPGSITLSWTDPDLSGETLANGATVFQLCFTALAGNGSTNVSFSGMPTAIEVINASDMTVPFNSVPGTVSFTGGGGGGGTPNPLSLTIGSASNVMNGQQVCLNVTANDFTNLNALSFSMNYTASQLTFVSVGNFNVPGLSATNFNTGTAGTITMSWTNTSGQTLSNGSVLFNICFTAAASTGSTQVSFANTPTMISATNASGQSVTVNPTSGTVSFTSGSNPTGFTLTVASATNVSMGDQVCLNVTAANFTSIVGMQFSINYNPAQLQFVSVGSFGLPGLAISSFGMPIAGGAGLTSAGNITLSWTDPDLGGETLANGATVFQLCFTALAGSGSTNVSFSGMPTAIEVINASDQTVPFNSVPGTVSFTGGGGGGGNPTGFTLTVASATNVSMGDQVCLNVTAANFTSIVGMQFSINYNPAMLQFVSVGSFGLPGLAISSFGMPIAGGAGLTSPGSITLSWTDPDLGGETLANGATVFQLCFTALAGSGSTNVSFSGMPTAIEVINASDQTVPFNSVPGTVSFTGGGGGGGNPTGFTLTVASATNVSMGDQVCLNVTAANFTSIVGMQFSINYNPAMLQFVSVGSFGLPGLAISSFGMPIAGGAGLTSPGSITLSWTDPDLGGETLANGATVFQLCFTALAGSGSTNVSFSGMPTAIEVINASDQTVPFNSVPGTVSFTGGGGGGGNPTGFTLTVASATNVSMGDQVCLNVTAANFTSIVGMQFSINYNPAMLQFVSVGSFGLPGLAISSFGMPIAGGAGLTSPGSITLSWTDPDLGGETLANGATVFQLCFTALAGSGSTNVSFSGMPTAIEVINASDQTVPFNSVPGTVSFTGGGGGGTPSPLGLTIASASNVMSGQQVCLNVTANDFTNLNALSFSINYTASQLTFVSVGNFNVPGLSATNFNTGTAGTITMSWTNTSGQTLSNGSVLFNICFTAAATTGSTQVSFANTPTMISATNAAGQSVTVNPTGGTVSFMSTPSGFTLIVGSATNVSMGQQVCLDVTTANFNSIVGMQFSINYNPAMLQLTSVGNFGLQGLTISNLGLPISGGAGMTSAGNVTLSWTDPDLGGETLPDGTVLFQLCFNALASSGTTTVSFSGMPTQIEISNASSQIVPFNSMPGTVSFTSGGGGGTPTAIALTIGSNTNTVVGQQVCLNVTAQNFTNVIMLQATISYDAASLQFVSVGNFGLAGLTAANFNTGTPGVITMSWTGASPQTLADNSVLFNLCFTALNNTGSTQVAFGTISATGSGGQNITVNNTPGTVSFIMPSGFALMIGSASNVSSGQQVCLNVSVANFTNIIGMQFSINYNPAMLQLTSVGNFGLQGLTISNFGLPIAGGAGMTSAGNITLSWTDPDLGGETLTNGTTIFQLCFTALVSTGSTTVSFSSMPTAIEVTNTANQAVPFNSMPGIVTFGVPVTPPTIASPAAITNVACFGAATGAIDITVQGGSGNFTYLWSFQGRTTQDITGIPAGNYSVTVTDVSSGLSTTGMFVVTQPSTALTVNAVLTQVACNGTNTGAINLSISGGTPQYSIAWCCGLPANQTAVSNLAAGTYTVTITDNNGCMVTRTETITSPTALQISTMTAAPIMNGNDGSITIGATGGTPGYTFSWTGPAGFGGSMQPNLTGLNIPGEYCLTVRDSRNCSTTRCVQLTEAIRLVSTQIVPTCSGASTGSIAIEVQGGTAPYTYTWNPGGVQGASRANLAAGNYAITVTDQAGGQRTFNFTVGTNPAISLNPNITNASGSITDTNGSIALSVTGGTPGFTVLWSPGGATSTTVDNLAAGQYCVTVTDMIGCIVQDCYTVGFNPGPLVISNTEITPLTCPGDNDGSAIITLTGGLPPFSVVYSDGFTQTVNGLTINRTGLTQGTLTYTVTDAAGMTVNGSITIAPGSPVTIGSLQLVHDTELPGCSGSIQIDLVGGLPPYQLQWNTPNTGGTILSNLCAGTFVASVTDANGCVYVLPGIQVNTFTLNGLATAANCPADATGSFNLMVTGGSSPYTFEWRNAAGSVVATTEDLTGVPAGTYTVRVTEGSGNVLDRTFVIASQSSLALDVDVTSNYNGFDVSCHNATDGMLQATAFNGQGSITYQWLLNGNPLSVTTSSLQNAAAGNYTLMVTDSLGCTATETLTVNAPQPVAVTTNAILPACAGGNDGQIFAMATGGVSNLPFTFEWSNGAFGPRITFLRAGDYTVTVNDVNNCSTVATVTVENPPVMTVQLNTTAATEGCNGAMLAVVTGGTAPYTYAWSTGVITTDPLLSDLCPGDYFVMVTDSRGCRSQPDISTGTVRDRRTPCLDIRTVITPDGDGLNEEFLISCIDELTNNHLEIYNRWGQLVFEVDGYDNTWTGNTRTGVELPDGPYFFVLEYTDIDGVRQQLKGSITLLRR
jgi:gliding motility-associated-like protein